MHQLKKAVTAGLIGNTLEWYDFSLFGLFAPVIARQFFPSDIPFLSLLSTFAVFAVGFLVRPIGAILFGEIGDRSGRRAALLLSIVLMAVPTLCMGLLPTYGQAGIAASIALVFLRMLQGLSIGGEYAGSVSYVVEHAPAGRRGLVGSTAFVGCKLGAFLGTAVAAAVTCSITSEEVELWGWRIPFLLGIVIALPAFFLRRSIAESPVYVEAAEGCTDKISPLKETLRYHASKVLLFAGIIFPMTVWIYTLMVYMPTYLHTFVDFSLALSFLLNLFPLLILALTTLLGGWLSDKLGRRKVIFWPLLVMTLIGYPAMQIFASGNIMMIVIVYNSMAALLGILQAPVAGALVENFPTRIRYTAVSLSYNISTSIFGGCTPLIATALIAYLGNPLAPAYWAVFSGVVGLAALSQLKETYRMEALAS
ncbi:MAG: MFS transporter [Chlamydiales bacterium]|nr:MFS transporter [Chlamydiia bacterium]MCP5508766.1 MFS transporter [Chlamydiales bacterium]